MEIRMNMLVLRKSNEDPKIGDIFVFKLAGLGYGYGRVIGTDGAAGPGSILTYLYGTMSRSKTPLPPLSQSNLLLPPLFVTNWLWQHGYFETIANIALSPDVLLDKHCFKRARIRGHDYCDESGNKVLQRFEPCGIWGVWMAGMVDIKVSEALGVNPHPSTIPTKRDFFDVPSASELVGVVFLKVPSEDRSEPLPSSLAQIEDRLTIAVERAGYGEVDGHEIGEGFLRIPVFGRDKNQVRDIVLSELRNLPVPSGSYAVFCTAGGQIRIPISDGENCGAN